MFKFESCVTDILYLLVECCLKAKCLFFCQTTGNIMWTAEGWCVFFYLADFDSHEQNNKRNANYKQKSVNPSKQENNSCSPSVRCSSLHINCFKNK